MPQLLWEINTDHKEYCLINVLIKCTSLIGYSGPDETNVNDQHISCSNVGLPRYYIYIYIYVNYY